MKAFLQLPDERKTVAYEQVSQRMGIPASYVEKDLWACWVLHVLFSHPELSSQLTFRGGTSLSKGFGLIERFSEDIDLAVSRIWLGITDSNSPETATNPSQLERRQKQLRKIAREKIILVIAPILKDAVNHLRLKPGSWSLELSDETTELESARDPYCIFLNYPCLTGMRQTDYIRSRVKIEFSAKAEGSPEESVMLSSFVAEQFPEVFKSSYFPAKILSPSRTLLEKLFIIHEENTAPDTRTQQARLARHYYDLHCLIQSGKVVWDNELFEDVNAHRSVHFRQTWVDYPGISPVDLQITPISDKMLSQWQGDYQMMRSMIYGDYPSLDESIATITKFLKTIP